MNILLVEDESVIAQNIIERLKSERYRVEWANDGDTGLAKALFETYNLIVLDVLLPGIDGFSILKKLRDNKIFTPVLMLTALGDTGNKVKGLDSGADDYLTKPFAMDELSARIRVLLRRKMNPQTSSISIHDLNIDTTKREVSRNGKPISLTTKEFQILEFMAYNKNRALSRMTIAEHVWQENYDSMSNFVDVHIKNIRKKIDAKSSCKLIKTVRGLGYMINDE
ncbi:MAG: response regulator transcription factor [Prolixibacteraceae bacterium]|nr:response regulator transcription factor [Prolixibacteraceae bacterium]